MRNPMEGKKTGMKALKKVRMIFGIFTHGILFLFAQSFVGTEAFAIDQVRLKDGQLIEGTVLSDVPNRYLDIRLVSGQTRRIQKADVESVERDLPSETADRAVIGNESRWSGAIVLGGASNLSAVGSNMNFNFGLRLGMQVTKMDFAWLTLSAGYDYLSNTNSINTLMMNNFLVPNHDFHLEMILSRVGQTGFYFGPGAGFAVFQNSMNAGLLGGNTMTSSLAFGGVAGYSLSVSKSLHIGPDLRFEYVPDRQMTLLRYGLQLGLGF
jgi:hypothetical protein